MADPPAHSAAGIEFVDVTKTFQDGTRALDGLTLTVNGGEFMILVGPSGCGKTTALRLVAGLERASGGQILVDGQPVNTVEPVKRDVAMVFQNYALYPHMSVRDNLSFPLRMRRMKRGAVQRQVEEAASLLGIEGFLDRKPSQLSGGQRQRVAMGRALVRRPKAFLMDEPLSNLDAKLRVQVRAELVRLHRELGITTIYVTHDQTEAMTLGQRVAVLNHGLLQQVATPWELYHFPANLFVAGFIGSPAMNFVIGHVRSRCIEIGPFRTEAPSQVVKQYADAEVIVGIRPEHILLGDSDIGVARGRVEVVEELGSESLVYFSCDEVTPVAADATGPQLEGTLVARLPPAVRVSEGDAVMVGFAPAAHLFERDSGRSIAHPPLDPLRHHDGERVAL